MVMEEEEMVTRLVYNEDGYIRYKVVIRQSEDLVISCCNHSLRYNSPSVKRSNRLDFPTAVSPTSNSFKRWSYSSFGIL